MPKIGDITTAKELGYKSRGLRYIWLACPRCGKERWVQYAKRDMKKLCFDCANKNRRKEVSIYKDSKGYNKVLLAEDDFFISMANHFRYVPEHRLVMARYLGRCLHRWEIVHHKNHIRDDNRIENLQLVSDDRHMQISILEQRIKQLEKIVTLLEAENKMLKEGN